MGIVPQVGVLGRRELCRPCSARRRRVCRFCRPAAGVWPGNCPDRLSAGSLPSAKRTSPAADGSLWRSGVSCSFGQGLPKGRIDAQLVCIQSVILNSVGNGESVKYLQECVTTRKDAQERARIGTDRQGPASRAACRKRLFRQELRKCTWLAPESWARRLLRLLQESPCRHMGDPYGGTEIFSQTTRKEHRALPPCTRKLDNPPCRF